MVICQVWKDRKDIRKTLGDNFSGDALTRLAIGLIICGTDCKWCGFFKQLFIYLLYIPFMFGFLFSFVGTEKIYLLYSLFVHHVDLHLVHSSSV